MKVLLVVYSYHHNNIGKIADVFAKALEARIKMPRQTTLEELQEYELKGFGSGIDSGRHYKELLDFADKLPHVTDRKAIIFSTCGMNKGRPNAEDLKDAEEFARTLKRNLKSSEPWIGTRNYPLERRPAAGNKNPALSSI